MLVKRLSEITLKLNEQKQRITGLETDYDNLKKEVANLKASVNDLENQS